MSDQDEIKKSIEEMAENIGASTRGAGQCIRTTSKT